MAWVELPSNEVNIGSSDEDIGSREMPLVGVGSRDITNVNNSE